MQIKKQDIEGDKVIELEDAYSVIDMIEQNSAIIQESFDKWTETEREEFKTHFNGLIYGAKSLGNLLVEDTKTFKEKL